MQLLQPQTFTPSRPRRWFCVQLTRFDLKELCWPRLSARVSESSKHVLNPHLPPHYGMLWSNVKRCSVWSLATIRQLWFFFFPAWTGEWGDRLEETKDREQEKRRWERFRRWYLEVTQNNTMTIIYYKRDQARQSINKLMGYKKGCLHVEKGMSTYILCL